MVLPCTSASVVSCESSGSLSQLQQEECAGERGLHSPSPRERAEDALRGVVRRGSGGIMLFSDDTVSCCSIQLQREAARGGGGEAGPAGAGAVQGRELLPYRKPRSRIWLRGGWLGPSTAMAQGLLV